MDFNAAIDIIIKDLTEAQEIIDDLKKYPEVPVFQIELAKSKCRSAAGVIAFLKDIKTNSIKDEIKKVEDLTTEIETEAIRILEKQTLSDAEKRLTVTGTPVNNTRNVLDGSEMSEGVHEKESEINGGKKEPEKQPVKKGIESAIIADSFSHLSNRFNEQIGSTRSNDDMAELLKSKPLTNLSEAIGINDRFLFIREIFNGSREAYLMVIDQLDNSRSFPEARELIMNYKGDEDENEAVKQLLDIVKRKFPSNE